MSQTEQSREKQLYRVTLVGSAGNMILMLVKFVAGILGHSAAMIADAVHSLSDFATDVVVLVFVKISSKPSDKEHDYGHGKYETLATAIIALSLFVVGIGIMWNGATKVWDFFHGRELEEPGMIALIAAIASILSKEALYQYTMITARRCRSELVRANAWHHRSDALSSIGTAIGIAGAIFFGVKWRVLDPIAAIVVSVFIIKVAYDLIKPSIDELLERSLPDETEHHIEQIITSTPGVCCPHHLRTRRIGSYAAVDFHIRVAPDMTVADAHELTKTIEQRIREYLGKQTIINIHVEPRKESTCCQNNTNKC